MLRALTYIHSNSLCHRDISLQNFLVGASFKVILCDFGNAKVLN